MSWNNWTGKKAPKKGKSWQDNDESKNKENKAGSNFPSYDKMDGGSGSSLSSGSTAALPDQVMAILQQCAARDPMVAASLEGVLPDPGKEEIRDKQRQINAIRKTQQKIDRKESTMQKREAQMVRFMEEIKNHVNQEKLRYKQEMEELKEEVRVAKIALQELKDGKTPQEQEHDELETLLDMDGDLSKENQCLKAQLQEMERNSLHQQNQLYNMQQQMAEFMRHYMDQKKDETLPVDPNPDLLAANIKDGMMGTGEAVQIDDYMATPLTPMKRPLIGPFRPSQMPRKRQSPYGKDGMLEALDK